MGRAYNMGSGTGSPFSRCCIACEEVDRPADRPRSRRPPARRSGGPDRYAREDRAGAGLVASPWETFRDIVRTAWDWHRPPARLPAGRR